MNSREIILEKLNKAKPRKPGIIPNRNKDKEIYSDYPDDDSLSGLFAKRFEYLNGELHITKDIQSAAKILEEIITSLDNKKCVTFSSDLTNKVLSSVPNNSIHFDILERQKINSQDFAEYSVGLTTAECLIARTGSIVLNSLNNGGRRLSVLPPIHIVIAESNQIIASLDEIFTSKMVNNDWSFATIISGPSRTSDIEKQLVLGAHGPKRLIVILLKNI